MKVFGSYKEFKELIYEIKLIFKIVGAYLLIKSKLIPHFYTDFKNGQIIISFNEGEFLDPGKFNRWLTNKVKIISNEIIGNPYSEVFMAEVLCKISYTVSKEVLFGNLFLNKFINKWEFTHSEDPNDILKEIL